MADPIIFTITEAGKQAAFAANADSAQLKINLTQVAVGTKKRTVTGNETALTTEFKRGSIVSGDVEAQSNTLRFTSSMTANVITDIYEIGLMTDGNVLFAVAGSNAAPLFSLHPDVTFVIALGLSLDDIDASNITVTTDTNGALSIVMMENHLAAPDPHPQYLNKNRFQLAMRALYPMGYQHHSHEPVNPKPIFDDILGLDTAWRRVTGKIFVSSDPSDPFINTYGLVLGQKGMTDVLASGARPHVYPLQTTHTFERYNPDDVIATVWKVVANKTAINEGGAVRFTVTANNLPDGQILNWSVKEGALNGSSNDITSPQKTDSGTVILRNGQAVIDFTTTPDDNVVEPQKHVRITIGAPANLSINVPITDAGHNETALHITQSTNNGIDLAEYYKQQSGSYPTATDKVRFIVDAGVDIVAPDTSTPAMIEGSNWTSGAEIVVENRGRILGRGGDGGISACFYIVNDVSGGGILSAETGGNGGTAVKGDFVIDNYGLIAGGGGGGGGMGGGYGGDAGFMGGGGSGGGAPFGKASLNANTYPRYLEDKTMPATKAAIPNDGRTYFELTIFKDKVNFTATDGHDTFFDGGDAGNPLAFATYSRQVMYLSIIRWVDENAGTYNVGDPLQDSYPVMRMSQDATLTSGGQFGYGGGYGGSYLLPYRLSQGKDPSLNHGGKGGNIGESGGNGVIAQWLTNTGGIVSESAVENKVPSQSGGLAGYTKEGSVTITNFSGGTTKGR